MSFQEPQNGEVEERRNGGGGAGAQRKEDEVSNPGCVGGCSEKAFLTLTFELKLARKPGEDLPSEGNSKDVLPVILGWRGAYAVRVEHNTLWEQVRGEGARMGPPTQPHRPPGTSDAVLLAKDSSKSRGAMTLNTNVRASAANMVPSELTV